MPHNTRLTISSNHQLLLYFQRCYTEHTSLLYSTPLYISLFVLGSPDLLILYQKHSMKLPGNLHLHSK